MIPRFLIRLPAALVFLGLFGCGLAEYESKMQKSEALANRFDEEYILLDEPLLIPTYKVKDPLTNFEQTFPEVSLFLQPPKGIGREPKDFNKKPLGVSVARYRRKQAAVAGPASGQPPGAPPPAAAAAPKTNTDFLEVTLAWGKESVKEKFQKGVRDLFTIKGQLKEPKKWSVIPMNRQVNNRPLNLEFETYEFDDPEGNHYSVNFRTRETIPDGGQGKEFHNVAIAYKVEKGKKTKATERALALSLETLAMEKDEVFIANRDYLQHFPLPPAAAPQPGAAPPQPGVPGQPK
jgi:hypothetical protein